MRHVGCRRQLQWGKFYYDLPRSEQQKITLRWKQKNAPALTPGLLKILD